MNTSTVSRSLAYRCLMSAARQCGFCTNGGSEEWCVEHGQWKCVCPCISMGGGGMLAPGAAAFGRIGAEGDSCQHYHSHQYRCCACAEHWHLGAWYAEEKTNIVIEVSHLDVYSDDGPVGPGRKFARPAPVTVAGTRLSESFGDARIVASHELHQSHTATSSWTVAAIGLHAAGYAGGYHQIRGGTNCVSHVWVITESQLAEGSLLLTAGPGNHLLWLSCRRWCRLWNHRLQPRGGHMGRAQERRQEPEAMAQPCPVRQYLHSPACFLRRVYINESFATAFMLVAAGILVNLDPASHDSAGYTLSLDGAPIAAGQRFLVLR